MNVKQLRPKPRDKNKISKPVAPFCRCKTQKLFLPRMSAREFYFWLAAMWATGVIVGAVLADAAIRFGWRN